MNEDFEKQLADLQKKVGKLGLPAGARGGGSHACPCGGTVLMTAAVIGLMTMAMPRPARLISGQMCEYGVCTCTRMNRKRLAALSVSPTVIGTRDPMRLANRPASGAKMMIITVIGRARNPA